MNGMMTQAQPTAQPSAPSQGQPAQPEQPPQEQTPADGQAAYDVATGQMLQFVYDDAGVESLTGMIEASGDPQQAMARLFGRLLNMTVQSAVGAGKRVAPNVILRGGIEVIRAMSEVAQSRGLLDPSEEKAVAEAAFFDGITLFAQEASEDALSAEEREQYATLLEQAEQMQQQGGGEAPPAPAQEAKA